MSFAMDKDPLLSELDASMNRLAQLVSTFSEEEFARRPSPTEWSAAQIAGHLLLLEKTAIQALQGRTVPTNRAPDNKLAMIKWVMEDGTKRRAPETVIPSLEERKAEELVDRLKAERKTLKAIVESADLTEACMSFKHPGFGTLTRLEWVNFIIHHTARHTRQMESRKQEMV